MTTVRPGDRVRVHYVIRHQDGSVLSSRGRAPLEVTVGINHPRLPGLGLALVGLSPGTTTRLSVLGEQACGVPSPSRVRNLSPTRFLGSPTLVIGEWVRIRDQRGRPHWARIVAANSKVVVVETNLAGQTREVEVEVISIQGPFVGAEFPNLDQTLPTHPALGPKAEHTVATAASRDRLMPHHARAVAFNVDTVSLLSLQAGLPGWEIEIVNDATVASVAPSWNPGAADLLVVGVRDQVAITLELCRFLAFCTAYSLDFRRDGAEWMGICGNSRARAWRADAPLLVLLRPGLETLVEVALEAGAHGCLILPIHAKEVASMLAQARAGNRPGRHTLGQDRAQFDDPWRDDGGEA